MELNPSGVRGFAPSFMLIAESTASFFLLLGMHRSKPELYPARPCQQHPSSASPIQPQTVPAVRQAKGANAWPTQPRERNQRKKELTACEKSTLQEISPRCIRRSENAPKSREEPQGSSGRQAWRKERRQARGQEKGPNSPRSPRIPKPYARDQHRVRSGPSIDRENQAEERTATLRQAVGSGAWTRKRPWATRRTGARRAQDDLSPSRPAR